MNWIRKGEMAVFYPVLIALDEQKRAGFITEADYWRVAKCILNYNIRRFACILPTNGYRGLVDSITKQLRETPGSEGIDSAIRILAQTEYPSDEAFAQELAMVRLYEGGRKNKTRVILEILEDSFGHRESANLAMATIEHIMPQTLSAEWAIDLGPEAPVTHELQLNTLGNLTLSGYNGELSNAVFSIKRATLLNSHFELNRSLGRFDEWGSESIQERGTMLAMQAVRALPHILPEFAENSFVRRPQGRVMGTTPYRLTLLGQTFEISSWRDMIRRTMDTIALNEPEDIERLARTFPSYVRNTPDRMITHYQILNTEMYVDIHGNAETLLNYCKQMTQSLEFIDDFAVETR